MKVKVNENKVLIEEIDKMNAGEYKIHNVEFELDEVYNDLIKKVTFSDGKRNFLVNLEGDTCDIPYEIFEEKGRKAIGFYAYESVGDELVLRYSPKSAPFNVSDGSYREDFDNYHEPTPDMIDQLEQKIQEVEDEIPSTDDFLSKEEASETYATISDIPDTSDMLTKTEASSTYATKNEIPDISSKLDKTEAASTYATINAVDTLGIFSTTEEIEVGKWINDKTLYRKVFESTTSASANVDKNVASVNGASEICFYHGDIWETATNKLPVNFRMADNMYSRVTSKIENENGNLYIKVGSNLTSKNTTFIVYYTK